MKGKIFATLTIFAAMLAMVGATTAPVFAAECTTTGKPAGNPCTTTTTKTEPINPGLDEKTTTTTENTCVQTKDPTKLVGASGICSGTGQTQLTKELSSECNVVAKNAHQGEGQVTGRSCAD
jgi:hypothetical protein